uniref:ABC1 kinase family protein n=1 Tax=Baaleninema simplex TaxID=2862350 RepID=UPI0003484C90
MSALSEDSITQPARNGRAPLGDRAAIDRIRSNSSGDRGVSYASKSYRWNRKNYSKTRRRLEVWSFVSRFLFTLWLNKRRWSYVGGYTDAKATERRRRLACWIRETFLDLGPTFIKLGQLFSTRSDLFPAEYVEELSKLQDRVPAFDYEQAEAIVREDFGKSSKELYRFFDPVPLAAASLGQVHKAQLHSGEEIVVKVQRPGLKRLFDIDLSIARGVAQYLQNHSEWGKGRDWMGIYDECCRILYLEIDYLNEGRNADTFRRNFRSVEWVRVPRVYWRYTSSRVLTLEYVPGIKISHYDALEAAGLDRKKLASLGAMAYLKQLLDYGFFHADPHPGNLAVSPEGSLIFYDFGMMGQITSNLRQKMMELFFGIAQRDADRVVVALVEVEALAPMDDPGPVRRAIQYILDNLMDKPFEEQSVEAITDDLYEIAYDQPFRFPATFTFVMRAFSTLEGVGKGLDPDFNFMEVAKPFALNLMNEGREEYGNSILSELSRQASEVSSTALGLPRRIEDTLEKLERGDIRVRVRATDTDRVLRRTVGMQLSTNYTLLISAFTLSATILLVNGRVWIAGAVALLAIALVVALLRLLARLDRADRF